MAGEDLNANMLRAQQAAQQALGGKGIFGIQDTDVFRGTSLKAPGLGEKMIPSLAAVFQNRNAARSPMGAAIMAMHEQFAKMKADAGAMYAGDLPSGSNVSSGMGGGSFVDMLNIGGGGGGRDMS